MLKIRRLSFIVFSCAFMCIVMSCWVGFMLAGVIAAVFEHHH